METGITRTRGDSPRSPDDVRTRRASEVRRLLVGSVVAAVLVVLVHLIAVRTDTGQRFDDIAFDGRAVEDPEATRVANEILHSVTRSSLVVLTAGIVVLALLRRRLRLAAVSGAMITASVLTTEILKNHVLGRPDLGVAAGIEFNSYPSGHATIGMALSLGLVLVTPVRRLPIAAGAGSCFAMLFGVGVLATGWHRPSDVLGAFLVCAAWFGLAAAVLVGVDEWGAPADGDGDGSRAHVRGWRVVAGGAVLVAIGAAVVGWSLEAGAVKFVDGGPAYLLVCAVLLGLAVAEVLAAAVLVRRWSAAAITAR